MADANLQRLVVQLEARVDRYEKALAKARGTTNRQFSAIRASAGNLSGVLATVGVGFSVVAAQRLIDSATRIRNALKVAGLEGANLSRVYDSLYKSAQRNAAPLESLVELYGRASQVQTELGVSTDDLLRFTDKVAVALRVSGKSASESSGALLQLSQALGSGTVRAEEFNSILEGALPIAQAAAWGLKEAGGSVAKLRTLVVDGKVSSEAFFRAFEVGAYTLEQKVAGAEMTVSQGLTRLQNVLVDTAGKFDSATGLSKALGEGLSELSGIIGNVGQAFADNQGPIQDFFNAIAGGFATLEAYKEDLAKTLGLRGPGSLDDFLAGTNLLKGQVGFASDRNYDPVGDGATFGDLNTFRGPSGPPKPISLADFKNDAADREKAAKAAEKQAKAYADVVDELKFEQSQLGKNERDQRIANELRRAGISATSQQGIAIAALVTQLEDEKTRIEELNRAFETAEGLAKDFAGSLIDDLMAGKSATEALSNAFKSLAQRLLQMAAEQAISALFQVMIKAAVGGFSGGGYVAGAESYDTGGYTGPGGKFQPAGVVHKGEYVFDKAATSRIGVPRLEALRKGRTPIGAPAMTGLRGYANGGLVGAPRLDRLVASTEAVSTMSRRTEVSETTNAPVINFAPVLQSGVSRAEVDGALRASEKRLRQEVPGIMVDARRRGKV